MKKMVGDCCFYWGKAAVSGGGGEAEESIVGGCEEGEGVGVGEKRG